MSRIEPHVWRIAIVVILGAIMSILDTTVINVALETLSRDFDTGLDHVQWVVTGYMLALAAVIPVTGWAARRFGSRRLYIVALALFTAGSALCALAWSADSLIAFRVLQGLGGGMIMPLGQIILVKAAGPQNLPRVMSAIGVPMLLAPVFGPTLGGLLVEHAGWQWIFLINVPIGIGAVIAGLRLLPHDEPEDVPALDLTGLALVATGLVGITYGLAETGIADSITDRGVLIPLLAGFALVTVFVLRSLRIPRPLLDLRLYRNRSFSAAAVAATTLGAAMFGAMLLMPLYFQTVRGEDAVNTGLLLIPQGIGATIAMWASGRLTERIGGGMTAVIGIAISSIATIPYLLIDADTSYTLISGAMVIRGLGIGLSMMPAMTAAFATLRPDQINDATPQLTTLQRVGGSIGTAIFTVVLQGHLTDAGAAASAADRAGAFNSTYWWVIAVNLVALIPAAVLAMVERSRRRSPDAGDAPAVEGVALEATA